MKYKKNDQVLYYDHKTGLIYRITKVFSDHLVSHTQAIYLESVCRKHRQQFSADFFEKLLLLKEIILYE